MRLAPWRGRRAAQAAALMALCAAAGRPVLGTSRLVRHYGGATGLPSAPVFSLAQDTDGFVWIGAQGGLARYDGHQFRRWAPDEVAVDVPHLAAGPRGELLGVTGTGLLFQVTPLGVRFVEDAPGEPLRGVQHLDFDEAGTLWIVASGAIRHQRSDGGWTDIPRAACGDESIRFIEAAGPSIYATSSTALWRIDASPPWRATRIPVPGIVDGLFAAPDGTVWLGTLTGLKQVRGDRVVQVPGIATRAGPFARRGEVTWVSTPFRLVGVSGDVVTESLGPAEGVTSAGALLVDRDGGLWVGTFTGVLYFPEPETQTWDQSDGLKTSHGRRVIVPKPGEAWLLTWQGLSTVERQGSQWRVRDRSDGGWGALCLDEARRVWTPGRSPGTFAIRTPRRIERPAPAAAEHVSSCAPSAGGGMWFGQASGVFRVSSPDEPPLWIDAPPWPTPGAPRVDVVFEDRHRRLWVTRDADVCRTTAAAGSSPAWACQTLAGAGDIGAIFHTAGGAIWVATHFDGVWSFRHDQWTQVPASLTMNTHAFAAFAPGRDDTIWIAGGARVTRVSERPDEPAGWQEVERLGVWEGYDGVGVSDVTEEPDGTVWLASSAGLVRVPARVRQSTASSPAILLTEILADGVPRTASNQDDLDAGQALELRFAVTSYRDRGRLRIEARVDDTAPWLALTEEDPTLRLAALAPGSYQIEARASTDGANWSSTDPLGVVVLAPWYRRWWSLVGLVGLAGAAGAGAYRLRVALSLRLQEQRIRIARDLHDELGAGLGSIGILAGIAKSEAMPEAERQRVASVIAESAADLGNALSDIVWSLRRGPTTLKALADHLAERGRRLIPGPAPSFDARLPTEWPEGELSVVLRRNVMLIVLEALRNAATHARAAHITLDLFRVSAARWRFVVEDDGLGLDRSGRDSEEGLGLENMRMRAEEIGATLTLRTSSAGGTRLDLIFDVGRHGVWRRLTRSGDGKSRGLT